MPRPDVRERVMISWMYRAARVILPELADLGIKGPGDKWMTVRFEPMGRYVFGRTRVRGDLVIVELSTDWLYWPGPPFVVPLERRMLQTFVHELLHALDRCESVHGGRWRECAQALGLIGLGGGARAPHL